MTDCCMCTDGVRYTCCIQGNCRKNCFATCMNVMYVHLPTQARHVILKSLSLSLTHSFSFPFLCFSCLFSSSLSPSSPSLFPPPPPLLLYFTSLLPLPLLPLFPPLYFSPLFPPLYFSPLSLSISYRPLSRATIK